MIDCVAYRFNVTRIRRHLADGARVQVFGRATMWAPRGRTQLVVETLRPAGKGALMEELLRLKERLAEEGLFDASRKRPLPEAPRRVGVVTSPDGAAWHDIRTVAARRGSVHLILSPAIVQGEDAALSIVEAIDRLERLDGLDVLIVGRGGGAFEDLLAFSDERVVRRIAACRVPVVSAVGHEIDSALCDFAADARAATPSEAAELVVPDRGATVRELTRLSNALRRAMRARVEEDRHTLSRLTSRMTDPRFVLAEKQQWLDDLRARAERTLRKRLRVERSLARAREQRLIAHHPRVVLARSRERLLESRGRLERAALGRMNKMRQALLGVDTKLQGLSPLSILSRGYSIALDERGQAVRNAGQIDVGAQLHLRLHSGLLDVEVLAAHDPAGLTEKRGAHR
jgi:exodeoxyribonuclease VII large subunit